MRDAISLLDQLASSGQAITLAMAQEILGTATSQAVLNVIDALTTRQTKSGLDNIHMALDAGSDPRQFARQIVDYLRDLLLMRTGNAEQVDATAETRSVMARHAQAFSIPELLRVIRVFNQAANDARGSWQPALPLEMAFVDALEAPQVVTHEPAPQSQAAQKVSATAPAVAPKVTTQAVPAEESSVPAAPSLNQGSEQDLTLQMVTDNWRRITSLVRQKSPNVEALLKSGRVLGIKDGVLYYGLSEVLKSKLEKSESIALIQEVLSQVFGREVPFRCVASSGKTGRLPPDVDGDGMVAAALRDLGGEIVDVQ
jgi:DNA polymerase-3 subunit gamma/tau